MSRCEDDEEENPATAPASAELIAEAIAHATDFLFDTCQGEATCITRGPGGEYGAIFVLKDPEDVDAFMRLYIEKFHAKTVERVDVVARTSAGESPIICNVPPDFESN
jgi:hypothetical protein